MTEPLSQYAPVRLLIAEISENDAHACDSLLRDAGNATRTRVVDLPMALASVNEADLLVANSELPDLQLLLPNLIESAPDVPVILVNNQTDTFTTTAGLKLGAADVVPRSDPDRLILVIKRELENISRAHLLSQTRRALAEAVQRCQLLMDSSHAAVAYVHEGMHIHANASYLELFGIEDADDLPGLPLMDLLDQHSADTLKSALKKFRNDGEQTTLEFTGQSTQGGTLAGSLTLSGAEYEGETCIQVTIQAAPVKGAKQEKVAEATQSGVPAVAPTASDNLLPMTEFLGAVGSMEDWDANSPPPTRREPPLVCSALRCSALHSPLLSSSALTLTWQAPLPPVRRCRRRHGVPRGHHADGRSGGAAHRVPHVGDAPQRGRAAAAARRARRPAAASAAR